MDVNDKSTSDEMETSGFLNASSDNAHLGEGGLGEKRNRKKTSECWQYFTLHPPQDGGREQIAVCNHCGHHIRYISANGTGGLRSHIARCSALNGALMLGEINTDIVEDRKKFTKPSYTVPTPTNSRKRTHIGVLEDTPITFAYSDSLKFKSAITEFVLRENLPFQFPHTPGFKQFLKTVSSNSGEILHHLPSSHDMDIELNQTFEHFLHSLTLNVDLILTYNLSINLLVNMYQTSRGYKVITIGIQYVNQEWELENFLVGIKYVELNSFTPEKVAGLILECLEGLKLIGNVFYGLFDHECISLNIDKCFWKLFFQTFPTSVQKKLTSSTGSSSTSNDLPKNKVALLSSYSDRNRASNNEGEAFLESFNSKYSFPYILSTIAQDALDSISGLVNKIRNYFSRTKMFLEQSEGIDMISANNNMGNNNNGGNNTSGSAAGETGNWRSTIDMIHYCVSNKNVLKEHSNNSAMEFLTSEEWKTIESIDKLFMSICLAIDRCVPLSGATNVIPVPTYRLIPTTHYLFSDLCDVSMELNGYQKSDPSTKVLGKVRLDENELLSGQIDPVLPRLAIGRIVFPSISSRKIFIV
jgi:hypothetical protein